MEITPELRALADELRSASERIATRAVPEDRVQDALALARELSAKLEGPRRTPWYELDTSALSTTTRELFDAFSPYGGSANPIAPPLRVEFPKGSDSDGQRKVVGRVRLSRSYEGPPHGVHGGVVAGLFDDLLGNVLALAPPIGMTGKLEITYRRITPIDRDLVFEGWVEEDRGRALILRAVCRAGEEVTAEARGLFVRVDFGEVAARER